MPWGAGDFSELEIRTLVDEIDIGNVKAGLRVESTVEAFSDMRFEGTVMKIEPRAEVQQSVTTFPVLSRIDNSEGLLLPGMNADVSIIIHERSGVLTVANEAVRTAEDAREIVQLLGIDAQIGPVEQDARVAANAERPGGPPSERVPETRAENGRGNDDNGSSADRPRNQMMQRMGRGRGQRGAAPVASSAEEEVRQQEGIVFVLGADGRMTPRGIIIGVRDWEVAEVLSGLELGEEVVLLPSTSLLRSQERERRRYTQRAAVVPVAGDR